jgi:hypothetical protein
MYNNRKFNGRYPTHYVRRSAPDSTFLVLCIMLAIVIIAITLIGCAL